MVCGEGVGHDELGSRAGTAAEMGTVYSLKQFLRNKLGAGFGGFCILCPDLLLLKQQTHGKGEYLPTVVGLKAASEVKVSDVFSDLGSSSQLVKNKHSDISSQEFFTQ